MPLFETKVPIDQQHVAKLVLQNWGIKIEKLLKASQNHTFLGTLTLQKQGQADPQIIKYSIRVTPDPGHVNKHFQRIRDQLFFVNYCAEHKLLHVCAPVPTKTEEKLLYVKNGDLIISVFEWARGQPVNFFDLKWMSDVPLIKAWGRYFGQLHKISKQFSKDHPEVANRIQNWNQIHHGVLSKIKLSQQDEKQVNNPHCFGVLHGDLNTSNSFYNREDDHFSVYDTDQTQRGFYQWDVAQAVFGVVMLKQAGMPISGDPVPQANRQFFQQNLISGYESVNGKDSINRERLNRMIQIKKQFYRLFCTQAIQQGQIPKQMEAFIHFIAKSFNKPKSNQNQGEKTQQKKEDQEKKNESVQKDEKKVEQ